MWPRILADFLAQQLPTLTQQVQAANETYDKPVNWWLAWGVIGLTAFAAGVIGWIFWQLSRQDKQLEVVRDQEMTFLRRDVVSGLSEVKKTLTEVKELLLRRRGGGGSG